MTRSIYSFLFFSFGLLILIACSIEKDNIIASKQSTNPTNEKTFIQEEDQKSKFSNQRLSKQQVEEIITKFGPILYLHSYEKYLIDDPKYVLDNGAFLEFGAVRMEGGEGKEQYNSFRLQKVQRILTSSKILMDDVRWVESRIKSYADSDNYKYWLHIDETMKSGSLLRAKALIRVLPVDVFSTEIQFWFFYPFNGPGRVETCASSNMCDDNWLKQCGRHYGDWERVSLWVSNATKQLNSVYMSRHGGGEEFSRLDDGTFRSVYRPDRILQFHGSHPIIYSAVSSHAHYHKTGNHFYKRVKSIDWKFGTASADLFDRTDAGKEFRAYDRANYRFISSDYFNVVEAKWLNFAGRWGQYEKLRDNVNFGQIIKGKNLFGIIPLDKLEDFIYAEVGSGPVGPKMQKTAWEGDFESSELKGPKNLRIK